MRISTVPKGTRRARPRALRFNLTVQGPDRPGLVFQVVNSLTNAVNNLAVAPIGRVVNVVRGMSPQSVAGAFHRTAIGSAFAGLLSPSQTGTGKARFLERTRIGIGIATAAMLVVTTTFNNVGLPLA